jgi:hypothetical protein
MMNIPMWELGFASGWRRIARFVPVRLGCKTVVVTAKAASDARVHARLKSRATTKININRIILKNIFNPPLYLHASSTSSLFWFNGAETSEQETAGAVNNFQCFFIVVSLLFLPPNTKSCVTSIVVASAPGASCQSAEAGLAGFKGQIEPG